LGSFVSNLYYWFDFKYYNLLFFFKHLNFSPFK